MQRTLSTLAYLRPMQALHLVRHRVIGASRVKPVDTAIQRNLRAPGSWLPLEFVGGTGWEMHFLSLSRLLNPGAIDWAPDDVSRLWRYNLHYFEYLNEADRPDEVKQALIDDWIAANPQGSQPAWEPYTVSLRIANWIKYFLKHPSASTEMRIASLYTQARWLRKNLELHLLANHYFENLKALVFAGAFFSGLEADGWLKFARRELAAQLSEQTLSDGGHYERTPAYHCLMLQNYLELYALAGSNQAMFADVLTQQLYDTSRAGLEFLADILLPRGRIPLFNDSAYNSAPSPEAIFAYASSLGIEFDVPAAERIVDREASGIYGYISHDDGILIDCGEIGPRYQPGHTHCDFLSYELVMDGSLLVVDTGVYEYEPGEARDYVRQTEAHNTVSVAGDEQSEIWGEFRVAGRARREFAAIDTSGTQVRFQGAYRGFFKLGGKVKHERVVTIIRAATSIDAIEITDTIHDGKGRSFQSYIHLHPDVEITARGKNTIALRMGGRDYAIMVGPQSSYAIKNAMYCPEFGMRLETNCIVVEPGAGNAELSYQIRKKQ